MTFREPLLLAGLALVPLALVAYVVAQRRQRRFAVRYTNVDVLASVAARVGWTRHIPALLALLALIALLIALARPERTVAAEQRQAMVVMVTDTSGSMFATDVNPDRLTAAKEAGRTLADKLPRDFRLGLVGFGTTAELLVEPTTDKARVRAGLEGLAFGGKTAMGDGLALGLEAARTPVANELGVPQRLPAAIVLLSDGANTAGDEDPITVAERARRLRIPVYTVALGTQQGLHRAHAQGRHHLARAGAARHDDAAGDRARDARPLLRGRRRAAPDRDLPRPRHAAGDQAREAGGDRGVRRRRPGAAGVRHGGGDGARRAAAVRRGMPNVERTPERPGPGPVPPAVLRSLDLAVLRRVESLVPGEHLTPQVGAGTELAMIRPYFPGDDVRHIDWNVTARMREPHVRVHVGERALTAWLVLDTSASMTFGTAERRKADVAEGVAIAVGHVASRRGNRLGVVAFGGGAPKVMRPRQGRIGLLQLLAELRREPEEDGAGATSLGAAIAATAAVARQRGLVVLVSDFRGGRDWEGPIRALRARHGVLAVEIRDPREMELTPMGDLWLVDPETGRQLQVNTSRRSVRRRFAKAAAEEREEVAATLRRAGADHLVLSTEGDWLRDLAAHLRRGEAALRATSPARAVAAARAGRPRPPVEDDDRESLA